MDDLDELAAAGRQPTPPRPGPPTARRETAPELLGEDEPTVPLHSTPTGAALHWGFFVGVSIWFAWLLCTLLLVAVLYALGFIHQAPPS